MPNPPGFLDSGDIRRLKRSLDLTAFYEFPTTFTPPVNILAVVAYFQQNLPMVYAGATAPEGVQSAYYGSMYNQDNGLVYRKSSAGYGNTGWDQLL